jgi:hypothetical protein
MTGWCWFGVREKHGSMTSWFWLISSSEPMQLGCSCKYSTAMTGRYYQSHASTTKRTEFCSIVTKKFRPGEGLLTALTTNSWCSGRRSMHVLVQKYTRFRTYPSWLQKTWLRGSWIPKRRLCTEARLVYAPNHNVSWLLQNSEPSNHQASALLNKTSRIRIGCAYYFCKGE